MEKVDLFFLSLSRFPVEVSLTANQNKEFLPYQVFLLHAFWTACVKLAVPSGGRIVDTVERGHQGPPATHNRTHAHVQSPYSHKYRDTLIKE